jgi:hypothetical protein
MDNFKLSRTIIIKKLWPALLLLCAMAMAASAQKAPDDCSWQAEGKSRMAVKLRTAEDGKAYTDYNQGRPITVDEWFNFTCGLDKLIPQQIPADHAIEGAETVRVTLEGYLLGARFERDKDHDIHVELGASSNWETDHVVLEMSAGDEYCAARQALWKIVRQAGCHGDECILRKPVKIVVTGYVLTGNPKPGVTDYCHAKMGSGIRKGTQESRVRGIWRLQPVLSVRKA